MIAALFVLTNGPYVGLSNVDPWTVDRDARSYNGPYSVVAHPPCGPWGRLKGQCNQVDNGCFKSALKSVRYFGGVLEHPWNSSAFSVFGLPIPQPGQSWSLPDAFGGRSIYLCQSTYGHLAIKETWLYAVDIDFYIPIDLIPRPVYRVVQNLSKAQRERTPLDFRDLLIRLAESVTCA
jgi:hypothetical protein